MGSIKFKRAEGNTNLPLPRYTTAGAAGMDLHAFLPKGPITFRHGQYNLISLGFHVELPEGVEMQIRPRSGLALRCSIPDDHIDPRRSALFMARSILREVRDGGRTC